MRGFFFFLFRPQEHIAREPEADVASCLSAPNFLSSRPGPEKNAIYGFFLSSPCDGSWLINRFIFRGFCPRIAPFPPFFLRFSVTWSQIYQGAHFPPFFFFFFPFLNAPRSSRTAWRTSPLFPSSLYQVIPVFLFFFPFFRKSCNRGSTVSVKAFPSPFFFFPPGRECQTVWRPN